MTHPISYEDFEFPKLREEPWSGYDFAVEHCGIAKKAAEGAAHALREAQASIAKSRRPDDFYHRVAMTFAKTAICYFRAALASSEVIEMLGMGETEIGTECRRLAGQAAECALQARVMTGVEEENDGIE